MSSNLKSNKPFKFRKNHSSIFPKEDITCEEYIPVNDKHWEYKGINCSVVPATPVDDIILPATCRNNLDCPRGYLCSRNQCIFHTPIVPVPDPNDPTHILPDESQGCNINGWVDCGPVVWDCEEHQTMGTCASSMGNDNYGCVWCPDSGNCYNRTQLYSNDNLLNSCGFDTVDYGTSTMILGCTDPYAINYNPRAIAQRDGYGNGCPDDKNCCLYEGAKLDFTRDTYTQIDLKKGGSYIIVFWSNDWDNGGVSGKSTFWDVFESLGSFNHAPESVGGDFYVQDNNNNNLEEVNEIRNGGFYGGNYCDPITELATDSASQCETHHYYHISTFIDINFISKYVYKIYECGGAQGENLDEE